MLTRSFDIRGLRLTAIAGVLFMEGEVACYRTKKLAEATAARLLGYARVVNRLRVVPQGHRRDAELAEFVRMALRSSPDLAGESIAVSALDGKVTLGGCVCSPVARCEAEALAWAVGGVRDVENRLRVKRPSPGNGRVSAATGISPARR
ncbi:MAG: hypothetical protein A2148_07285 [Chloroflexi bacterium RBG_16_68_14]|nr:MAG: hypothetical protein A2148_07285 [Chloroflexi bacterium RBG_16_68_14]